jgi:hypothetical protein
MSLWLVAAPPTAPTAPPINAPVRGLPPVTVPIAAPVPAPSKPPETARSPVLWPQPAKASPKPTTTMVPAIVRDTMQTFYCGTGKNRDELHSAVAGRVANDCHQSVTTSQQSCSGHAFSVEWSGFSLDRQSIIATLLRARSNTRCHSGHCRDDERAGSGNTRAYPRRVPGNAKQIDEEAEANDTRPTGKTAGLAGGWCVNDHVPRYVFCASF